MVVILNIYIYINIHCFNGGWNPRDTIDLPKGAEEIAKSNGASPKSRTT